MSENRLYYDNDDYWSRSYSSYLNGLFFLTPDLERWFSKRSVMVASKLLIYHPFISYATTPITKTALIPNLVNVLSVHSNISIFLIPSIYLSYNIIIKLLWSVINRKESILPAPPTSVDYFRDVWNPRIKLSGDNV